MVMRFRIVVFAVAIATLSITTKAEAPAATTGTEGFALDADAGASAGAVQHSQQGFGPIRAARSTEGLGHRLEADWQVAGRPVFRSPDDDPVCGCSLGIGRHLGGD